MKRLFALLLAAVMILSFWGCEKAPAADTPEETALSAQDLYGDPDEMDVPPTEPVSVTVEDRYDMFYPEGVNGFYCCHIPGFVSSDGRPVDLNPELEVDVLDRMRAYDMIGDQPGVAVHYFYGQARGLTSLVVEISTQDFEQQEYLVYTLRAEDLKLAQPEDLFAAFGYSREEGEALVRSRLEEYFRFCYGEMEESMGEFFTQQLETTLSEENLERARLFVDEAGQLSLLVPVYGFAGAAYYYHRIRLEGQDFTTQPDVIRCREHR